MFGKTLEEREVIKRVLREAIQKHTHYRTIYNIPPSASYAPEHACGIQCVAVRCSVLQCFAVCVAVRYSGIQKHTQQRTIKYIAPCASCTWARGMRAFGYLCTHTQFTEPL